MRLVKRTVNQDDVSAYHLFLLRTRKAARHRPHVLRLASAARAPRHSQHCSYVYACERVRRADMVVGAFPRSSVSHSEIFETRWASDSHIRRSRRAAARADRRQRRRRRAGALGPQPGSSRAADSRTRSDYDQCADSQSDRSPAHACLQHAPGARLSPSR